jgi:hypothetical protein
MPLLNINPVYFGEGIANTQKAAIVSRYFKERTLYAICWFLYSLKKGNPLPI